MLFTSPLRRYVSKLPTFLRAIAAQVVVSGGEDGSCPTDADDEGGLDMAFYWD